MSKKEVERNRLIMKTLETIPNMAEVARMFKICRERVRQIKRESQDGTDTVA